MMGSEEEQERLAEYVRGWRCEHCAGRAVLRQTDDAGHWHAEQQHDEMCPANVQAECAEAAEVEVEPVHVALDWVAWQDAKRRGE